MQRIAQAWLVLSLTHSPFAVGVLALAQFLPFTVFGLFAGVVVDRLDARRTVLGTQAASMVLAAALAAVVLAGVVEPWYVYAIAALQGSVQMLDAPARQALTYRMVGPAASRRSARRSTPPRDRSRPSCGSGRRGRAARGRRLRAGSARRQPSVERFW